MAIQQRIEFLKDCILYLESKPTESALISQRERLKTQYESIKVNYFGGEYTPSAKELKLFEKITGAIRVKTYYETLTLLIDETK